MLIEFTSHSPKVGRQEHVSQTTAAALIAAGLAVEVILTEEEKRALRFGIKPFVLPEAQWSVVRHQSGDVVVLRRCGSETHYFGGVPNPKNWPDLTKELAKELSEQFEQMKRPGEARTSALPYMGSGWREKLPL